MARRQFEVTPYPYRIHKDTPEPSLLKPHGESQISRYPDGKGPILLAVIALPNELKSARMEWRREGTMKVAP